jgi:UDP-N-acetylmuramate: L-alanyl-gamma-D-glutamyl-meso-diaminopimelate ligase
LRALAERHPGARIFAVFEPRSATACRNLHQTAYADSFEAASQVLIAPLGRTGLPAGERLDCERLARDLSDRGRQARANASIDEIVEQLLAGARPGDVIVLLSNGAFGGIHRKLLDAFRERRGDQ